jgi:hypothetical protein
MFAFGEGMGSMFQDGRSPLNLCGSVTWRVNPWELLPYCWDDRFASRFGRQISIKFSAITTISINYRTPKRQNVLGELRGLSITVLGRSYGYVSIRNQNCNVEINSASVLVHQRDKIRDKISLKFQHYKLRWRSSRWTIASKSIPASRWVIRHSLIYSTGVWPNLRFMVSSPST